MPSDSFPESNQLKDWFNPVRYRSFADSLGTLEPRFDREVFLTQTLEGLDQRELKARLRQTVLALHAALPGPFKHNLSVLRKFAPKIGHSFIAVCLADYAAEFGLNTPAVALPALKYFTSFGSAEFAIRPFIIRDQAATVSVLTQWAEDKNEHVRRLASEGSRPRLPWGQQLRSLVRDPSPVFPILTRLRQDPSLYVRKSVANHLNDITKDNADLMLDLVGSWDRSVPETEWIVQQGLRTLIKQGHPRALALCGVHPDPKIEVSALTCAPSSLRLGDTLSLAATVISQDRDPVELIVDYVIHYLKASGASSAKVFKGKTLTLAPGQKLSWKKRQVIRDFSTRKHHSGVHRIDLQINGQRIASTEFMLRTH
jgi:3-methyladenine DNA glycosylase AlkC